MERVKLVHIKASSSIKRARCDLLSKACCIIHSLTHTLNTFYGTPVIGSKTERITDKHIGSLTLGSQYIKGVICLHTCDIKGTGYLNFSMFPAFQVLPGSLVLINGNQKKTMSVNIMSTWQEL